MSNITEELFNAVQLLVDSSISNIPLDETVICRITDVSDKATGKYRVQTGDLSFYAYSDNASYYKDEEVRVVIPGDGGQKYILGKYVKDDGSPVTYVSPADSIINVTGNILAEQTTDRTFLCTAGKSATSIPTRLDSATGILSNSVYDSLVIEGDFRTLLQEDKTGEYGIAVAIYGSKNGVASSYTYQLSSTEMFGDPYNFQIYTPQAKAFALPKDAGAEMEVTGLRAYFYQHGFTKTPAADNVLIRNLSIWFGCDTSSVEDRTSQIYTNDSLNYKYYDATDATNQKTINLLWYKKTDDGKYQECTFGDDGYGELQKQQFNTKIAAQMGRENGPKSKRELCAAAALADNKKTTSTLVSLVKNDLKQLIRSMESEAGLEAGTLTYASGKLFEVGKDISDKTVELGTALENLAKPGSSLDVTNLSNLDEYVNNVVSIIEDFFSENTALANATGVFELYKAKWAVLKSKITKALEKVNTASFGGETFASMTGRDWTDEYTISTTDDSETEAAAAKYSCYWFAYDEQYNEDDTWASVAGQHWKLITNSQNKPFITYDCDGDLKVQQIKCIVFEDANYYESNILEFTNSDEIPNGATLDQADSLLLVHSGNYSRDSYLLYGDDGYLVDNSDGSIVRTIKCEYDGVKAGNEALNGAVVYWYIPNAGTMLLPSATEIKNKGLTKQSEGAAASKYPGYDCYSRTVTMTKKKGTKQETNAEGTIVDVEYELDEYEFTNNSNEFYYRLAEFYEPNSSNNSIICEAYLIDETKEETANDPVFAQRWFTIGQKGTCGTGYTLSVTHYDEQIATTDTKALKLVVKLFDENGDDCSEGREFTVAWVNHNGSGDLGFDDKNNIITVSKGNYGILKVSTVLYLISDDGTKQRAVDASILYAVPWSAGEDGKTYLFSGCTKVIYTTLGTLDYTSLYRQAYSLMNQSGQAIEGLKWDIIAQGIDEKDNVSGNYYPSIKYKDSNYYLEPAGMYLTGLSGWCYVTAKDSSGVAKWQQPIIITQSKYGSSVLNDWDGSFKIDENAGTVMGTMFAAGKKTSNNTFEGVIMGDVKAGLQNSKAGGTGIYGFDDGIESFGLKTDGTAFFGKPGAGQIHFNGNKGTIRSAGFGEDYGWGDGSRWREECRGMEIDLDDATIRLVGDSNVYADTYTVTDNQRTRVVTESSTNKAPNIIITANPQDSAKTFFEIQGVAANEHKSLMKVANNNYYLQSLDFNASSHAGTKIDIGNGTITSYNFNINAYDTNPDYVDPTILLNSAPESDIDYYFKVGKEYGYISLTKGGTLDIKADKLTLASPLSSANLLRNTKPCEAVKYKVDENGNVTDQVLSLQYGWTSEAWHCTQGHEDCVKFDGDPSQDIDLQEGMWYTLSGYLIDGSFSVNFPGGIGFVCNEIGNFEYTFQAKEYNGSGWVEFHGSAHVHHLKLEQNTSATPWCEHVDDAKQYADDKDNAYDQQLGQDAVFNKLTNNGAARGIYLQNNQLYINADYMAVGIIRSNNWQGIYTANGVDYCSAETYLAAKEKDYVTQAKTEDFDISAWEKKWEPTITATDGMYINLNDGQIWAKNFELNAVGDDTEGRFLYINSNGNGQIEADDNETYKNVYLGVGRLNGDTPSYMMFADGQLTVKGRIEADSGKIGPLTVTETGIEVEYQSDELLEAEDVVYVKEIPFTPDRYEFASTTTYTFTYSVYEQVLKVTLLQDFQEDPESDYAKIGHRLTVTSSLTITNTQEMNGREYITGIQVTLKFEPPGGQPDVWTVLGTYKLKRQIYTGGTVAITGSYIESPSIKGLEIATLQRDVRLLQKNLGVIGSSATSSTQVSTTISSGIFESVSIKVDRGSTYATIKATQYNSEKVISLPAAKIQGSLYFDNGPVFEPSTAENVLMIRAAITDTAPIRILTDNNKTILSTPVLCADTIEGRSSPGVTIPELYVSDRCLLESADISTSLVVKKQIETNDIVINGDITNNEHSGKLGALAFVDSVKKNFDISTTGEVTLTKDISDNLTPFNLTYVADEQDGYWVETSVPYSGTVSYTYTDSSGEQKTADIPYSGTVAYTYWYPRTVTTLTTSGVRYTGDSTISITDSVTLKGNTTLELGPSDTDTGTETVTIVGTQQ